MILEDLIKGQIYQYPLLFKDKDYYLSKLKALDHIFFTIGNGGDWKNGEIVFSPKYSRKSLPENYFSKELTSTEVDSEKVDEIKKLDLGYCYFVKNKYKKSHEIFYESNPERDLMIKLYFKKEKHSGAKNFTFIAESKYPWEPYEISEYSAIYEIFEGVTSEKIPVGKVQSDWMAGAVYLAKEALKYYNDENKYKNNHAYTDKIIRQNKLDRSRIAEPLWVENLLENETDDQFAVRIWNEYQKSQLDFLIKFLDKFGS